MYKERRARNNATFTGELAGGVEVSSSGRSLAATPLEHRLSAVIGHVHLALRAAPASSVRADATHPVRT